MDNPVAKALHDGLDALRQHGLAKWSMCDGYGRVCARGALATGANVPVVLASLRSGPLYDADAILSSIAAEQYPERSDPYVPFDAIAYVNNHDDTTQEDIERIFEKAIVKAYETL